MRTKMNIYSNIFFKKKYNTLNFWKKKKEVNWLPFSLHLIYHWMLKYGDWNECIVKFSLQKII